jgi:hypothetical protein
MASGRSVRGDYRNCVDHAPPPNQLILDRPLGRETVPVMAPFSPKNWVYRPVIFVGVSRNVSRWVPGASNAEPSA